jgi:hypothetical protein
MAISQLPQAPFRQDKKIFPTPIIGDVLFSEVRDCNRGKEPFPEYGTPHPNPVRWPDHKLVYIQPVDIERNEIFEFFYAADRENQDLYNFTFGLQSIGPSRQFRAVQRTYVTPRENFQPLDIPFGTPMPDTPAGKFDGVEYVFFTRQQQPIDQPELNSLYVAETHIYIERAFLDDKLSLSAQRNDPLPEKFQILLPQQTVEEIAEGTAEMPTLSASQFAAKEDQLTPDIKLVSTTSRDRTALPVALGQKLTTNEKQLAAVTETVQEGDTAEQPSATVDIQSEALGDGTYVVRKVEVPTLFREKVFGTQKPDVVPEKFKSEIPIITESSLKEGVATQPQLAPGDLERTEQQVNEFVFREQVVKRDVVDNVPLPQVRRAYIEGTTATVDEKLSTNPQIETGLTVIESEATPLGDGKFAVQTVKAEDWPVLTSSEWDPQIEAQVVRTEQMVAPPDSFDEDNTSYRAVNKDRTLKITEQAPTAALDSFLLALPTRTDVQLPPVLKEVTALWSVDEAISEGDNTASGVTPAGGTATFSLTAGVSSSGTGRKSATPTISTIIENVFGSDIPATYYFFYVKTAGGLVSADQIKDRLAALAGITVGDWPVFKPESRTIIARGASVSANAQASAQQTKVISPDGNLGISTSIGEDVGVGVDRRIEVVNLGPTLHGPLTIQDANRFSSVFASSSARARLTGDFSGNAAKTGFAQAEVSVFPASLPGTTPPDIPRSGFYIMKSSAEPYKWGYVRCSALVINASFFAS